MSKNVTIPTNQGRPFVVIYNGIKYVFTPGETVEVPQGIALVIEECGRWTDKYLPPENEGGGGGDCNCTPGQDGITPHIGENGNWYIGETDTGVNAEGDDGEDGKTPAKGTDYFTAADKAELINAIKGSLTLGIASDGLIYIFVDGTPVGTGIPQDQSGDVFGYVDENNTIVLNGNLSDGTYTVKYEMENGDIVDIGNMVLDSTVYYSVASNLTNCSINNSTKTAPQGSSFSATITANSGYELKFVTATMGGSAVTVTNGVINIASVTGDIVITAVAEQIVVSRYTNLADPTSADWQEGYRLSLSAGTASACTGHTVTNYIPAKLGDVLRVKGLSIVGDKVNSQYPKICAYNSSKSNLSGMYGAAVAAEDNYGAKVSVDGDISTYTLMMNNSGTQKASASMAYIRIDGLPMSGYTKNDVIITVNEEITD